MTSDDEDVGFGAALLQAMGASSVAEWLDGEQLEAFSRFMLRGADTLGSNSRLAGVLSWLLRAPVQITPYAAQLRELPADDPAARIGDRRGATIGRDLLVGGRQLLANDGLQVAIRPSVRRPAAELARCGWIRRDADGRWQATVRLREVFRTLAPIWIEPHWSVVERDAAPRTEMRVGRSRVGSARLAANSRDAASRERPQVLDGQGWMV